ncbi:PA14 domain-containing protein [Pseudobacteriovorax antillogorgiicola]|uniref:PA14 domain-containing protein n=1 Tax=Pseudobacteriovorax antillogorgiicola TaxID=1513793 RepID=A0A1Y6CMF4_9BACT|nr:PA14 domain-containing protein [Pseudobacteriovorax antillogorgiicola]TCS45412.1 PA14 domain-containing protein [Pseudobacteriovorax antillogorgiicola]SMF74018.1 PA14 domain-containing protein [Pseudobacteriovorax antillogorgiicola]
MKILHRTIVLLTGLPLACSGGSFKSGAVASQETPPVAEEKAPPVEEPPREKSLDQKPDEPFYVCDDNSVITANVYELEVDTQNLPDFSTMTPSTEICLYDYNIAERPFEAGFPGEETLIEWFALESKTQLLIPKSGEYEFILNSDDGSKLYIDNVLVIDNDGQHATTRKSAILILNEGLHQVRVDYFQGPRYLMALQVGWVKPGSTQEEWIPRDAFRAP